MGNKRLYALALLHINIEKDPCTEVSFDKFIGGGFHKLQFDM